MYIASGWRKFSDINYYMHIGIYNLLVSLVILIHLFDECCLEWSERIDVGYVRLREWYLALSFISRAMLQLHCICNLTLFVIFVDFTSWFEIAVKIAILLHFLILWEIVDKCCWCDYNCGYIAATDAPKTLIFWLKSWLWIFLKTLSVLFVVAFQSDVV